MKLLLPLILNIFTVISAKDHISTIIKEAGYRSKLHRVETKDGFLLGLHHMKNPNGIPVFLMHGIIQSAAVWVYNGPGKSLAMLLHDAGFDVWMLSARGTAVSAQHKSLTPNDEKYWDFSFHEIATLDLPATVDYILANTGKEQLHYVGHSQGGTVFVAFLSFLPEYNEKIQSAYLLAPATFMENVQGVFSGIIEYSYNNRFEVAQSLSNAKLYALTLRRPIVTDFIPSVCKMNAFFCNMVRDLMCGSSSGQLDDAMSTHDMMKYTFDNIAMKQFFHFVQLLFTDKFQLYDNAPRNEEFYGSDHVPEYNLTNLKSPLTVFYGTRDILVNWTDVEKFLSIATNIKNTKKLPWAHMDFVSGRDAPTEIFQLIIRELSFYKMERIFVPDPNPLEAARQSFSIFDWVANIVKSVSQMLS